MAKTNQSSIRRENIEAVFSSILEKDAISRSEIAEKSGLSLMTVGKVVDLLTDCGAVVQAKPATGRSGRRAGFLSVADNVICLVCNISSDPFCASVVNLKLENCGSTEHDYDFGRTPEENLEDFFTSVSVLLLDNLRNKKLMGTAVIYSGEYDPDGRELILPFTKLGLSVDPVSCMKRVMGIAPDIIEHAVSCAIRSKKDVVESDGLYLAFDVGFKISGCVLYDGRIISGERNSDFSSVSVGESTLGDAIKNVRNSLELAELLICGLSDFCRILKPRGVFIWLKLWDADPEVQKRLEDGLGCPVTVSDDGTIAGISGGAGDICRKWIEKNIFGRGITDIYS